MRNNKNTMAIHLEDVRLEKNNYHLVFTCYMPNSGLTEEFDYCGTDITGCVYNGCFLYKELLKKLQHDYDYPPFSESKVKRVLNENNIYLLNH